MDIIIVGGGKTGTYLASLLTEDGYRIRVIEARKDLVAGLRAQFGERDVILGNGRTRSCSSARASSTQTSW